MKPSAICSLAAALALAGAAHAGPVKSGALFAASSCADCAQSHATAAGNPAGSLLVAWDSSAPVTARGVAGRFYRPLGSARGPDFQVAPAPIGTLAGEVHIAGNAKGFVLVWTQSADDDTDVLARRYSPTGRPLGPAMAVNVDPPTLPQAPEDFAPAVAMAADGGFTVAWVRFEPFHDGANPGTLPAVFARRFTVAGMPRAPQQQVSTGLVASVRPALCVAPNGAVTVAWTSVDRFEPFEPSLEGVGVRRMQPLGRLARPLALAAPTLSRSRPAAACGKDGGTVVAWRSDAPPALGGYDVLAQRFAKDGKKAGSAFRVNAGTAGDQRNPQLSFDSTGAFVAVWSSKEFAEDAIRVRRFSAAGAPLSGDVEAWSDGGDSSSPGPPALAHTKAGNFAVAWPDAARRILVQRFAP